MLRQFPFQVIREILVFPVAAHSCSIRTTCYACHQTCVERATSRYNGGKSWGMEGWNLARLKHAPLRRINHWIVATYPARRRHPSIYTDNWWRPLNGRDLNAMLQAACRHGWHDGYMQGVVVRWRRGVTKVPSLYWSVQ